MFSSTLTQRLLLLFLPIAMLVVGVRPAQAGEDPVRITVGTGAVNAGNTVELTVDLDAGSPAPQTLILFLRYDTSRLAYDPDYYQFVTTDLFGNPALGNDGQPLSVRSGVMPGAVVDNAGKTVDVQEHAEGVGIAIFGLNSTTLADGRLLTLALKLLPGGDDALRLDVEGVDAGNPLDPIDIGGGMASYSSASYINGTQEVSLPVTFDDGYVLTACGPVADVPQNVQASTARLDGVRVTWDALSGGGTEYRVYRAMTDDPSQALPLGEGWLAGTSFLDVTAYYPATILPQGCLQGDLEAVNRHFYWVKARTASDCESGFQANGVSGYRGPAKAAELAEANVLLNGVGLLLLVTALLLAARRRQTAACRRACALRDAARTLPPRF